MLDWKFILRAWAGHYWRRLKCIEIDWRPVLTEENYWKFQRATEQDERRRGIGELSNGQGHLPMYPLMAYTVGHGEQTLLYYTNLI